ncbi:MAG: GGDEF domain-containing protein [Acholeplasmatales bacterium]|nr:GGDEF domain-containing protein [Acholeplasmatales bacterium]
MNMQQKTKLTTNYFGRLKISSEVLLDQLTKTINRKYILSYVTNLISRKEPFTMAIVDVDNFKAINDKYGHLFGDKMLSKLCDIICENIPEKAFLGRYGGDEFIIVAEGISNYDDEWAFLKKLINVIREEFYLEFKKDKIFSSVTIGSICYPKDGNEYNDLFGKADKALYRGKIKGRNCFIVYVEEKHASIDISNSGVTLSKKMLMLRNQFKGEEDPFLEIYNSIIYLSNEIGIDGGAIYFNKTQNTMLYSKSNNKLLNINVDLIRTMMMDEMIIVNEAQKLSSTDPFRYFIRENGHRSMFVTKVKFMDQEYGYLFLYNDIYRVWQEEDISLGIYLATLIALVLYYND